MNQFKMRQFAGEVTRLIRGWKRLSWELLWVITGQAVSVIGALVGVKLLTEALPVTAYGELALALTATILVNQVVAGPLSNAGTRFLAAAKELGEFRSYLRALAKLVILGNGIVTAAGFTAIVSVALAGHPNWIPLLGATLVFSTLTGCCSIMDGMQNAARNRSLVALHQSAAIWLRFLCAVWLVGVLGADSTVALWGYCLGSLLVFLSEAWFFWHRIVPEMQNTVLRPMPGTGRWNAKLFRYAWPYCLWGVVWWLYLSSDRWALQVFTSTEVVGRYAVVYQLGYYPLALISSTITQFAAPLFFQLASDGTDHRRKELVSQRNRFMIIGALCVSLCCVLCAVVLHKPLFQLLTAEDYWHVSWLLPATATSGAFFGIAQVASLGLVSNYDSKFLLKPYLCTAFLGSVLDFFGAWTFGLIGVVAAGMLSNGIYLLWILLLCGAPSDAGAPIKASFFSTASITSDSREKRSRR